MADILIAFLIEIVVFRFKLWFERQILFIAAYSKYIITGSGNGLASNRRPAITWTNNDSFNDAYMRY